MNAIKPANNLAVEILVVEDSPTQAEQLRYILEQKDYRVTVARNGREALGMIKQRKPTLVISDILMPEMDGYHLCREIRADEQLRDMAVILVTSLSDPEDVVRGLECGADNFIIKPYQEAYLLSRIQYILINRYLSKHENAQMGVEVFFAGKRHFITSDRLQILTLLLSTYETAVQKNGELTAARDELRQLNEQLEEKVKARTAALTAEIAERQRAEQRLAIQHAVTRILAESASLEEAAPRFMQTLLAGLEWDAGAIWRVDRYATLLRCIDFCHASAVRMEEFEKLNRRLALAPDEGFPGQVWQSCKPLWVPEMKQEPNLLRASTAVQEGVQSGMMFPILFGDNVTGVIELFSRETRQPEADVLQMMSALGLQIGQFAERKHLEEQLRQSQKMEAAGRLAGGVAHDFNNLLTVILGYSDFLLQDVPPDDHAHRRMIDEIKQAGERAATLTRQLLAFSRKQVVQPQVMNLNGVVGEMDKMLRRLIGEDIDLMTNLASALGHIKADPGQIEQVLMNLVVNARDAMPDGGKLTIETANVALSEDYARLNPGVLPGRYVMLGVSDTGCGMDAETQSRIFEPFFTTKGPDKGTGLGLSTVYGIVTQNNGHISVYSEVGQGTVFKVYFRRIDETLTGRNPNAAASEPPRGTETILVVEDGAEIRKLVRRTLENAGYTVLEASHGEEALRVCEGYTGPIHLLLTDVVMPQMSGRALTEQLTPRYPAMSVLYMSGYTNDAIIHHGVLGADIAFLQKPFTPDRLAATVRAVLDQAGK